MTDQYRAGQVIDALLALCRALPGHRSPTDTLSTPGLVTVFDGPEVRETGDSIDNTWLIIGFSGDSPETLTPVAQSNWVSRVIAATVRPRDESTTISCKVAGQRQETAKAARDLAIAELAAVAGVCRSDPSLGIDTSATIGGVRTSAWVTAGTLYQYLDKGYVCEIEFTVTYGTRV